MGKSKKSEKKNDLPAPEEDSDQDKENRNIDESIKKGSESESYSEMVNDAEEPEIFERDSASRLPFPPISSNNLMISGRKSFLMAGLYRILMPA